VKNTMSFTIVLFNPFSRAVKSLLFPREVDIGRKANIQANISYEAPFGDAVMPFSIPWRAYNQPRYTIVYDIVMC
jgi:hypothetical protein